VITTIAGNGVLGYSGDNGPAVHAALYYPVGLAVSARGDLYVAEMGNSVIRKIAAGTGTITTVVGTGISGYTGDNAPARSATLNGPSGIAIDQAGNLYIADLGNNSLRAVFASGNIPAISNPVSGNIYTLVGNGSSAAINATLNDAEGVAVDQSGNIYIADGGDNQTYGNAILISYFIQKIGTHRFGNSHIYDRTNGICHVKSDRHQLALSLRQIEFLLKYRDENIVTRRYKAPEEKDADEGTKLSPIGFLMHGSVLELRAENSVFSRREKFFHPGRSIKWKTFPKLNEDCSKLHPKH